LKDECKSESPQQICDALWTVRFSRLSIGWFDRVLRARDWPPSGDPGFLRDQVVEATKRTMRAQRRTRS